MLDTLNAILAQEGVQPLQPGVIVATSCRIDRHEALWDKVVAFGASEGWLCLTDELISVHSAAELQQYTMRILLSAELVRGDVTLVIRQHAEAGWLAVELQRNPAQDAYIVEETFLNVRSGKKLRYETCWSPVEGELRPVVSRFAGFAQGGNQ